VVSSFDPASLINVLPEILLLLLVAVVMTVDVFLPEERKKILGVINVVAWLSHCLWPSSGARDRAGLGGMIRSDLTALVFRGMFLVVPPSSA